MPRLSLFFFFFPPRTRSLSLIPLPPSVSPSLSLLFLSVQSAGTILCSFLCPRLQSIYRRSGWATGRTGLKFRARYLNSVPMDLVFPTARGQGERRVYDERSARGRGPPKGDCGMACPRGLKPPWRWPWQGSKLQSQSGVIQHDDGMLCFKLLLHSLVVTP